MGMFGNANNSGSTAHNAPQSTDNSTESTAGSTGTASALDGKLNPANTPTNHEKTASEAGLDLDSADAATKVGDQLQVAKAGPIGDGVTAIFSSHPIQNFSVGPFTFTKGVLKFTGEEAEGLTQDDFEELIGKIPAVDRNSIRKVDKSAAEKLVADHIAIGGASKQFDSGVGRDALERLHMLSPTVGKEDISHAKLPQTDNNVPVVPTPPVDSEGKTGLDQGAHTDQTEQG